MRRGPKSKYEEPMTTIAISLPRDLIEFATKYGGGNRSEGIRVALEEARELEIQEEKSLFAITSERFKATITAGPSSG
jgi:metal-responsive CopG/Arc/MetJ family transcriptional regulator